MLRLIESLQQQNRELTNQVMFMAGSMWTPPPLAPEQTVEAEEEEEPIFSAFHGLPPTESWGEET